MNHANISQNCDVGRIILFCLFTVQFCDIMILLRAFHPGGDADVVTEWYQDYKNLPVVRARLDAIMLHLRCQPRGGWVRDYYDTLRDGIGEVRFKVNNIHYRPLGFFGPSRNEFTFLLFSTKTKKFKPVNAIDIAVQRSLRVLAEPALSIVVKGRWEQ